LKKYKQLDLAGVQRPGNEIIDAALAWMEKQKENPFFSWIHFYDPHIPYEPPEPYLSQYKERGLTGLYDGEIAFMDEQIGRCISWLEQNELDKKTIIVIMGMKKGSGQKCLKCCFFSKTINEGTMTCFSLIFTA
jgi:arylsulfatase A-like enzyme